MKQIYACEQNYIESFIEAINNATKEEIEAANALFPDSAPGNILTVSAQTGVINIEGKLTNKPLPPIARFFGFSGTTYGQITDAVRSVSEDPSVHKVVLRINSPGGEVSGVDNVFSEILALSKRKQVIAENTGMIASAALWLACACDKIYSTSAVNTTGSIGVVASTIDNSAALEKRGIKRIVVTSKNAPNKRPDLSTDKGLAELQKQIDAIERVFISRVAYGRKVSEETVRNDFGKGGLLIAKDPDEKISDATDVGLIDGLTNDPSIGENDLNIQVEETEKELEKQENKEMTLKEIVAEHPELTAEVEALELAAKENGKAEAYKSVSDAAPYLSGNYPATIKELAAQVATGQKSLEILQGTVAAYEALLEEEKSKSAQAETEELSDVVAESPKTVAKEDDGVIRDEEDLLAAQERVKHLA